MASRKLKKSPEALAAETASIGRWMTIAEVELWAKNPRKNDGQPVDKVAASIVRFGFVAPVVGWLREDGSVRMVAGHTRVKALRKLLAERGVDWTPKHAPGPGVVPVRVIPFANEAEANAYALADNRLAEEAEWDDGLLSEVVKDLEGVFDGLGDIGFDEKELSRVANYHVHEPSPSDDEAPPVEEGEPDSKTGHVYELGQHRLVCGDCTKEKTWDAVLCGERPMLVLTDPPYGVGLAYSQHDDTKDALRVLASDWLPVARAFCETVVFSPGVPQAFLYPEPDWILCWFYGAGQFRSKWGFNCWQPFLAYGPDPSLKFGEGCRPDGVNMNQPANMGDIDHPCPKPISLWVWLIERCSFGAHQIIADPFSGSGTTLIACAMTGRVARCIEIDPHYCDVIRRRWTRYAKEHGQDPGTGALE